ncbi:hypothetical protein SNE40_012269 [Patella caerulea]|uniref:UBC core domain-containing protein n=1 Tax=Patella caerulea TaxID=87958 RepID=A0AAN8JR62_PATCE
MFSKAHLIIERDYTKFLNDPPWGIELFPLQDDNIYEFVAKIRGLKNTIWEGGLFRVYIRFDENYNLHPPSLCFHSIPFHPNIDAITGRPCVDFLQPENWDKSYSLSFVLLSIQSLLSNPNLRNAVNVEAVAMINENPKRYRQVAANCVAASQRLEAKNAPLEDPRNIKPVEPKYIDESKPVKPSRKISKLSFEDYYSTWCGIATSKSKPSDTNPLLEQLRDRPELQKTHMALPQHDIEEQIKRQVEEHTMLMYGKFTSKPTFDEEKEAKIARLQKMKKIYLPPRVSPLPTSQDILLEHSLPSLHAKEESWEKEVDDLVAWTSNLDTAAID